jgi:hypothetical protein
LFLRLWVGKKAAAGAGGKKVEGNAGAGPHAILNIQRASSPALHAQRFRLPVCTSALSSSDRLSALRRAGRNARGSCRKLPGRMVR